MAKEETAPATDTNSSVSEPSLDKRPPMSELSTIKYTGTADVKILTGQDLAGAGVETVKMDLRWDSQNDYSVSVSDVNAATLEYLWSQPDFNIS